MLEGKGMYWRIAMVKVEDKKVDDQKVFHFRSAWKKIYR
jgi:hypothetical protein